MDFTFSAEQDQLRAAMRELAADRCPPARLREVVASGDGYDEALWDLLGTEMGLAGVAVREERGGTGGSFVDAAVVFEEAGRALLPVPVLPTIVAAAALDAAGGASPLLPAVAEGKRVAVLAVAPEMTGSQTRLTGDLPRVADAALADVVVIVAGDGLYAVCTDAAGVTVTPSSGLDLTRRPATVELDLAADAVTAVGDRNSAERAVDLMRVALAVESVGVARHCLDSTVDYVKTRQQFGRPIGSFQALQHRLADLAVDLEAAASTAYFAAWASAVSDPELPVVAPLAKAVCTEAAYRIAAETIQLHGGIGFTWEHDAHLYFKRATANRLMLGDPAAQRRLVARRAGLLAGR